MINPGTGVDEAKYFAMTVALTAYVPSSTNQRRLRTKALKGLVRAVTEQVELRESCRDTDVTAATRVRAWLYSA